MLVARLRYDLNRSSSHPRSLADRHRWHGPVAPNPSRSTRPPALSQTDAFCGQPAGAIIAARHGATTKVLMHRPGHASPAAALRYQRAEQERDAALAAAMSAALERSDETVST
jgi:hypothetical protein